MALLYDCIFRDYGALQVQFEEYLKGIISQAVKSLGGAGEGVEVQFELESVVLASKTAMSLGLIAHELVWESLQRFNPHEGQSRLVVSMQGKGSGLVLDIQDNFSSGGVEGEKMSLSSQIVGALVQQFHGELLQAPGSFRLAIPSLSL
jgi:two-component sensor histidine kinase